MTKDLAVTILALERDGWKDFYCTSSERRTAFDMAIEALDKERSEEMGEYTDAKPISEELEHLETEKDMMQREYVECIKRLEAEVGRLNGVIEGLKFAIRCNGVSGGDVG